MKNLYNKYSKAAWIQLWADDDMAAVIYQRGKGYEVVTDNRRFVITTAARDLPEAFNIWNAAINQHLDNRILALEAKRRGNRLEYLRRQLRAENISYQELSELQSLIPFIKDGDVELLEAAGVPKGEEV